MYDATGVRLQAGRQAEVWYVPFYIYYLCHCLSFPLLICNLLVFFFSPQMWDKMPWKPFLFAYDCCALQLCSFVLVGFSGLYWSWMNEYSQVLNQIVYELPAEHPLAESRPLRELLGHTPPQVLIFHTIASYNYVMDLSFTNEIQCTLEWHCFKMLRA